MSPGDVPRLPRCRLQLPRQRRRQAPGASWGGLRSGWVGWGPVEWGRVRQGGVKQGDVKLGGVGSGWIGLGRIGSGWAGRVKLCGFWCTGWDKDGTGQDRGGRYHTDVKTCDVVVADAAHVQRDQHGGPELRHRAHQASLPARATRRLRHLPRRVRRHLPPATSAGYVRRRSGPGRAGQGRFSLDASCVAFLYEACFLSVSEIATSKVTRCPHRFRRELFRRSFRAVFRHGTQINSCDVT